MQLRDLWCATVLLGCCPTAGLLSVRVEDDYSLWQLLGQKLISLDVHAGCWSDAEQLSATLRLSEVDREVRPIRLVGHSDTIDPTTGEALSSFSSADVPLAYSSRATRRRWASGRRRHDAGYLKLYMINWSMALRNH